MKAISSSTLWLGIGLLLMGPVVAEESCRELGRTLASDQSGDEVILRECRAPRTSDAAPAAALARTVEPEQPAGPENDPATCRELWQGIGLPRHAQDVRAGAVSPVCHKGYVLEHNNKTRLPDWVVEHLTAEQVSGEGSRPSGGFKPEPYVPPAARAVDEDYAASGLDRGHQAPSEDFNVDTELMADTFYFSNVVPQEGIGFNRSIWKALETRVRNLAKQRGELYVITGPIYEDPKRRVRKITVEDNACEKEISFEPPKGQSRKKEVVCAANNADPGTTLCKKGEGAAVPAALFKILYDPANGRANAYVLPNIDHRGLKGKSQTLSYLEKYRTTVNVVEAFTGIEFLTALTDRDQHVRKEHCVPTMLH